MAADYDAFNFGGVGTECEAQEIFEAGAVESTAHADDAVLGQVGGLVDKVGHGVHGVGHAEDDCVGRVLEHVVGYRLNDAGVYADKFLAGHAGLAGNTRGDDNDV